MGFTSKRNTIHTNRPIQINGPKLVQS